MQGPPRGQSSRSDNTIMIQMLDDKTGKDLGWKTLPACNLQDLFSAIPFFLPPGYSHVASFYDHVDPTHVLDLSSAEQPFVWAQLESDCWQSKHAIGARLAPKE